ncbi:MAG: isocitrate/isopropylmalate dehydrogenase family protein [Spirochaetales bacterium]|nr:isocitrate/isopropylmalate dehydrogenase family protein [Spirochaetales bacterium]
MSGKKIAVIPGDGIGPEVIDAAVQVLKAVCSDLYFQNFEAGYECLKKNGYAITGDMTAEISKFDAVLFGANTTPPDLRNYKGYKSPILTLRRDLGLFANIRPVKSIFKNTGLDLLIFRENTEDLYVQREFMRGGEAVAEKIITEKSSRRIAELAYKQARANRRKKMTIVHKANVLKLTDGLFRNACRDVASGYPEITTEDRLVDSFCCQLVVDPGMFDCILTMNLYGDIISDLAAGIGDGLGFAPSCNLGDDIALFEPVHGSAPDLAGQNRANPIAAVLSAAMMLEYLELTEQARIIQSAVAGTLKKGFTRTFDMGGDGRTGDMTLEILKQIDIIVKENVIYGR